MFSSENAAFSGLTFVHPDRRTDGRTDGRTDRQTNRQTYSHYNIDNLTYYLNMATRKGMRCKNLNCFPPRHFPPLSSPLVDE